MIQYWVLTSLVIFYNSISNCVKMPGKQSFVCRTRRTSNKNWRHKNYTQMWIQLLNYQVLRLRFPQIRYSRWVKFI